MNYEQAADEILSFGINRVLDMVRDIVPNLNKYPDVWNEIPAIARPFITVKNVSGWINKIRDVIPRIPKLEKYAMVQEMKKIIESLEDAYMDSVLHKVPNVEVAKLLEGMGEMVFSGV